jgi:hypothetical protein
MSKQLKILNVRTICTFSAYISKYRCYEPFDEWALFPRPEPNGFCVSEKDVLYEANTIPV